MTKLAIEHDIKLPTEDEFLEGGDFDAKTRQILTIYDEIYGRTGIELSPHRIAYLLEKFEQQSTFIARDQDEDNEIVAVANVRFEQDQAFIEGIAVHPDWRHEGVGRELMTFIEEQGRQRQLGSVALRSVTSALVIYERLGYEYVNPDDADARLPLMRKYL